MRVLNIKNGIVFRGFRYFLKVEIERRLVLPEQHDEADDIGPTSSTTSRSVTNSPARFDIRTGSPPRNNFTNWQSLTMTST